MSLLSHRQKSGFLMTRLISEERVEPKLNKYKNIAFCVDFALNRYVLNPYSSLDYLMSLMEIRIILTKKQGVQRNSI